ncbi:MAG: GNAT family N-acetyltransferase, partial [Candidatus Lokiarchaeota archaeon]|nr:GNAT family N-acetyltransferase [Candidatus Lokiarchaeota archaeon]
MSISTNELNEKIAPFLDGDHICLLPIKKSHLDLYVKWMNNPRVRRLARSTIPMKKEDIEKRFEEKNKRIKDSFYFEIFHKRDKIPIGDCGFNHISWIDRRGNIGLGIGEPEYWNRGVASEAVGLLLKYGFEELNLFKIYADIFSPNIGSWKCAEKVGMKREAELKKHEYIEGKYFDSFIYSIFRDDW